MYKLKYQKYKSKYKNLLATLKEMKGGDINDLAEVTIIDDWEVDASPEDELPEDEMFDIAEDELVDDTFEPFKGSSEGVGDQLTEFLNPYVKDIGEISVARGRIMETTELDDEQFTENINRKDKNKILRIKDVDQFDNFTDMFGFIKDGYLYIKWEEVANQFAGVNILSSSLSDREDSVPFKEKTYPNWVNTEFPFMDKTVLFTKPIPISNYKRMTTPFRAKLLDPFAIPTDEFVRMTDPSGPNKILMVDDVRSFDKFTNKFGKLLKQGNIKIDWNKVRKHYYGFLIDAESDFIQARLKRSFYKGINHKSWLKANKITPGIVYLFE